MNRKFKYSQTIFLKGYVHALQPQLYLYDSQGHKGPTDGPLQLKESFLHYLFGGRTDEYAFPANRFDNLEDIKKVGWGRTIFLSPIPAFCELLLEGGAFSRGR